MVMSAGCTFVLVESTAHRLRYLATASGTGAPTVLPNKGGASPDLHTDLAHVLAPLRELVDAAITTTEEAERLLMGHQSSAAPNVAHLFRAHTVITPATPAAAWAVYVDEGAKAGDVGSSGKVVVVVTPPEVLGAEAYLDVLVSPTPVD